MRCPTHIYKATSIRRSLHFRTTTNSDNPKETRKATVLQAEVSALIQKNVLEPVTRGHVFYANLFLVQKKAGHFWTVTD